MLKFAAVATQTGPIVDPSKKNQKKNQFFLLQRTKIEN